MALGYTSRQVGREAEGLSPRLIVVTEPRPRFIAATLRLLLSDVYAASLHNHRLMLHRASAAAATRGRSTPASERPACGFPSRCSRSRPLWTASPDAMLRVGRHADSPRAIPARFARGAPR